MNLAKLFEMQKVLDAKIVKEHGPEGQDLLAKKILALQVELGELANEWRGFKFWSKDQKPRTEVEIDCWVCNGTGDLNYEMVQEDAEGNGGHEYIDCDECSCSGISGIRNPLLDEYVDCLHFLLSIGLETYEAILFDVEPFKASSGLIQQFLSLNKHVGNMQFAFKVDASGNFETHNFSDKYEHSFSMFLGLGEMLGFTWEQIEQAYMDKNKVNHERQNNGY